MGNAYLRSSRMRITNAALRATLIWAVIQSSGLVYFPCYLLLVCTCA